MNKSTAAVPETAHAETFPIADFDAQKNSGQQFATPPVDFYEVRQITVCQEVPETFHSVR